MSKKNVGIVPPETSVRPKKSGYSVTEDHPLDHEAVARLAYSFWEARGRGNGSAEDDWFKAEAELKGSPRARSLQAVS
jgi:hypothetical protein